MNRDIHNMLLKEGINATVFTVILFSPNIFLYNVSQNGTKH